MKTNVLLLAAFCSANCGGSSHGSTGTAKSLPLVSPPVKAALPASLATGSGVARDGPAPGSSAVDGFKERFFSGSGPTDVMNILAQIG